jgi:hypothetical protein
MTVQVECRRIYSYAETQPVFAIAIAKLVIVYEHNKEIYYFYSESGFFLI